MHTVTGPEITAGASVLAVENLAVDFRRRRGRRGRDTFRAVEGVGFRISPGRTLGLVGESGSGKSTIGRAVVGLVPVAEGRITFEGRDITHLSRRERRPLARDIQVVFQDPFSSLNPAMPIEDILVEPLRVQGVPRPAARKRIAELLDAVALPADAGQRRPREFSGGERQRVAIARSLATNPRLVICDEPVSGLDLKTQSRILDLFIDLQERTGTAYLFVSHDLGVIRHVSHDVVALLHGRVVEYGPARQVAREPTHEYVKRLFISAPVADPDAQQARRRALRRLDARPDPR